MATGTMSRTVLPAITEERVQPARTRWRWLRRLLLGAGFVAAVAVVREVYFQPPLIPVTITHARLGTVEELVTNNKAGTVRASRQAALSPELGGRVVRLPVSEGDRVRKGDVLLALSEEDARAQWAMQDRAHEAARLAAAEACARAQLAARELDRSRKLLADGAVSQQAVDLAQNESTTAAAACAAAGARVGQAVAAVTLANVSLRKSVLHAPFDAVVARVSTHLGEWIMPSPAGLPMPTAVELIDPTSIYIRAPLDEVDAGKVRAGQVARVTLDAFAGQTFAGRVTRVGSYVSEAQQQNRTFDIDVSLADRKFAQTLLPGTSADVEIVLRAREDVLLVPTATILQGGRVLTVRDGVLAAVSVKTGLSNWEFTEITNGLRVGDAVVSSLDRPEVREGARVRVEAEVVK